MNYKKISNYFQKGASYKKPIPFITVKGMGKTNLTQIIIVTVSNIKDTVTFFI